MNKNEVISHIVNTIQNICMCDVKIIGYFGAQKYTNGTLRHGIRVDLLTINIDEIETLKNMNIHFGQVSHRPDGKPGIAVDFDFVEVKE